jgi:KDO2-lipid IV(A) lauroyltransferase
MASDSKLLNVAYGGLFASLFPLFMFAARNFERRESGFSIADDVIGAFLAIRPKYLDAVRGNVARAAGIPEHSAEADRLARRVVRQHAYSWVDFFRFGQRSPHEAEANIAEINGVHHMADILDSKTGAILLTAHAGNYELGGLLLRQSGFKMQAVYKPDRFPAVERLRARVRKRGGVTGIPVDGIGYSTLPLLKLLKEGHIVGMQGDRDFSLNGIAIPFFGREAYFPRGPWELAALTGCPIITAFFYMGEDLRFRAYFDPPAYIDGSRPQRGQAIKDGMQKYVSSLEALIRKHPDQWCCFYPFWDDPFRKGARPNANFIATPL